MGLDVNGVKFLLYARREGVSFASTAMLGRQELQLGPDALADLLSRFGNNKSSAEAAFLIAGSDGYAEDLLKLLGAEEIVSFDASEYEGGSVAHDFNLPIAEEYKGRFSVVLDGGTLEHIFNFPQAVRNCMDMVADGGHFLGITPTNNHSGHGFYQFSPELLFRVFSPENGFQLQHLIVFEETLNCSWYEVADPKAISERVTIHNDAPTMLLVVAKKLRTVEVFAQPPQQSDYVAVWSNHGQTTGGTLRRRTGNNPLLQTFRLPGIVFRRLKLAANNRFGVINSRTKHFKKLDI